MHQLLCWLVTLLAGPADCSLQCWLARLHRQVRELHFVDSLGTADCIIAELGPGPDQQTLC